MAMKIVIGDLPENNQFHRLCICRKCGIMYLGKVHLQFRRFSVRWATSMADPSDGCYICRECGRPVSEEYVVVEREES